METEPDTCPGSPPAKVDERALMDIATNLPRYDRVDDIEAVGIFAELLEVLQGYLRTLELSTANQSTMTTMRQSLGRLEGALRELSASLQATDPRGQQRLYELLGLIPSRIPKSNHWPAERFRNAWDRGAYRMAKPRDYLKRLDRAVAASSAELASRPPPPSPTAPRCLPPTTATWAAAQTIMRSGWASG